MILSGRFSAALAFSFQLHQQQERAGSGVPYYAHLMGVASLALEYGASEDESIAALLHDAAEDQGGREILAEIERRFGPAVSDIVRGCTDSLATPRPPWRERKERYLQHLGLAPPSVQLVSACDKLYNARAIVADHRVVGESIWDRFSGRRAGVLWYYDALASAFTIASPVVAELRRTVAEMQALAA